MKEPSTVIVERMTNLESWELYRFADEATDEVVCKIALRPNETDDEIEYGVWRKEEPEPSATGSLDLEGGQSWEDEAREKALGKIARIYEDRLPEIANGLLFQIGDLGGDDTEDDDASDEEDEDDEEEDDEDEDEDDA